jgi:Zn-dependent protease
MSWSLNLGRVGGIPIRVHWTFLILLIYVGVTSWMRSQDLATALVGVAFVLALFGCVVLHELGHALTARRFGVTTSDITLLPIGGVARLQHIPEHPGQELMIALAGPLVNVLIVGILLLVGVRVQPIDPANRDLLVQGEFWSQLMLVNVILVVFNLLPAFPMDGGRVLRALLAMVMDYPKATRLAATVGQMMAILFGFLGLAVGNPLLLLIALFVWIGAEGEAQQVETRVALEGTSVGEAMLTDYHTLAPNDSLGHAADLLLAGSQQDFPVLDGQLPMGVLTRQDLLRGLSQGGRDARAADYLTPDLETVEIDDSLVSALTRLREKAGSCLQVTDQGRTVGLLTTENVGEFLMIRAALRGATDRGIPTPVRRD